MEAEDEGRTPLPPGALETSQPLQPRGMLDYSATYVRLGVIRREL